jgi:hypothetical protein
MICKREIGESRRQFAAIIIAVFLLAMLFSPACTQKSGAASSNDDANWRQSFKTGVIGDWEEVRVTQETLHFNEDGTLIMDSPSEHHSCTYDFPDARHIRLDCVAPQIPHKPNTYGFALADAQLKISDDHETGTYRRK